MSEQSLEKSRLRKQRTFCDATNGFPAKMKSEKRAQKMIWVVMRYQYRISALVFQTSFQVETFGGIAKWWLEKSRCMHHFLISSYIAYALSDAQYYFIHMIMKLFSYRHVFYFMYMVTVIFSSLQHACASKKSETWWAIHY